MRLDADVKPKHNDSFDRVLICQSKAEEILGKEQYGKQSI